MTTAKLRIAAWTLALGLTAPAMATPALADAPQAAASASDDRIVALANGVTSSLGMKAQAVSSANVATDPHSGLEIYAPTGETIDQVIEVVAAQLPPAAVASIRTDAPIELGLGMWAFSLSLSALAHLAMLGIGLLLFALGAKRWLVARESLLASPLRSLGTGVLTVGAAFVAVVLLALTLVGIPLAFFVGVVAWLGLYAGQLVTAFSLGSLLPPSLRPRSDLGQVAAGAIALWSISLVPGIGFITSLCASIVGLGACLVTQARDNSSGFSGASLGV